MSELDKTIEELEAEVLAELEEAEDPAMKGAAPAEKSDLKDESDKIKPEDASKKAKEVSGDAQQKGEGAPDKMQKLKAGYHEGFTEEEIRELCHSKDHDCATVIEHPEFGLGHFHIFVMSFRYEDFNIFSHDLLFYAMLKLNVIPLDISFIIGNSV